MSWTDQKRRIATEKDCQTRWGAGKPGEQFLCSLCGHKFKVGDGWRWVYTGGKGIVNFFVCDNCDGPDVVDRAIVDFKEISAGARRWHYKLTNI